MNKNKAAEVTQLLDWLTETAKLTYNDIAALTGVKRVTVARVWRIPPHYISDERLARLRYIKSSLEEAMKQGEYVPGILPRANDSRTVQTRVDILRSLID